MTPPARLTLLLAGFFGFTGIAAGAFGAHALRDMLSVRMLEIWHTAVFYQLIHTPALLVLGVWLNVQPARPRLRTAAGLCFALGVVIFSGSLYTLALSGLTWLGAITPIGGTLMLGGWACLLVTAARTKATTPFASLPQNVEND